MVITKLNQAEALRYMGYGNAMPDDNMQAILDDCERQLVEVIQPRYVYKVFNIDRSDGGIAIEGTSLVFKGEDIKKHLADCEQCVLMCATISQGADKLIRLFEATDMTKALMTDCLASSAIEQVCNLAEEEIKAECADYFFTWRFSPGYGDLPIEVQRDFISALNAQKRIGLNTTENMILIPRKSVTAIMGISKSEIPKGRRGCVTCKMKDTCEYRKRGNHCGF